MQPKNVSDWYIFLFRLCPRTMTTTRNWPALHLLICSMTLRGISSTGTEWPTCSSFSFWNGHVKTSKVVISAAPRSVLGEISGEKVIRV